MRWMILVGLSIAVLSDGLNGAVYGIARTQMMGDLHATPDEISWINIAYFAAKLAAFPVAGYWIKRLGAGRAVWMSLGLMLLSSLLVMPLLPLAAIIAARVLQGAFGALLLVSAQSILFSIYNRRAQGVVQAIFALAIVMAPVTAIPALHGWLVELDAWKAAFALSAVLPLIAAPMLVGISKLGGRSNPPQRPFDWMGFMLFASIIGTATYILLEGHRWNWFEAGHIGLLTILTLAGIMLLLFWILLRQDRLVLLDTSVFRNPDFTFGAVVSLVAGFALFGSAFLIPAFAMKGLGFTPYHAGLLIAPSALAVAGGLLMAGILVSGRRVSPFRFVPFGIAFFLTSLWMLAGTGPDSGLHDMGTALMLRGFGFGLLFLSITIITLNTLAPDQIPTGTGLFNFGRQAGGIFAVSWLSTQLDHGIAVHRNQIGRHLNPSSPLFQERMASFTNALTDQGLDPATASDAAALTMQKTLSEQVAILAFNDAFLLLFGAFIAAVPCILAFKLIQKKAGWA